MGVFQQFFKVLTWELVNSNNRIIVPYVISRASKSMDPDDLNDVDSKIYENCENIWEKMFYPIREYNKADLLDKTNSITALFPKNGDGLFPYPLNNFRDGYIFCNYSIYIHPLLPQIRLLYNECYNKFKWTPFLENHIKNNLKLIPNPRKTVAIFVRSPRHYSIGNEKDYIKNIIDESKVVIQNYEKLFLVTNNKIVLKEFTDVFGEKIIFLQDKNMVDTLKCDWTHVYSGNTPSIIEIDYANECIQSFTDVYLASTCDYILGGSSNMFFGALIINPRVNFKILNTLVNCNGL